MSPLWIMSNRRGPIAATLSARYRLVHIIYSKERMPGVDGIL